MTMVPVSMPTGQRIGADIAGGAGVEPGIAEVVVERREPRGVLAGRAQARAFARDGDALARRQRHLVAGAGRLAEAAFDAEIDDRIGERHELQVLDVHLVVGVEQHAGIEQALGVEQRA